MNKWEAETLLREKLITPIFWGVFAALLAMEALKLALKVLYYMANPI